MGAKLFFYYSAMNAGKSSALLQSAHNYNERGMGTLLFIPELIGVARIKSRIGLAAPAHAFAKDFDFHAHVAAHQARTSKGGDERPCACVLIDEAQFLSQAQVRQLCRVTDELQVPVLCFGLRTDFLGEPFEGSRYLLAWADCLSEIKTICGCGRKATMNQRVADDGTVLAAGEQVQVGGNERYIGKCRCHFWAGIEGAKAREAAPGAPEALAPAVAGFVEVVTPEKAKAATDVAELPPAKRMRVE